MIRPSSLPMLSQCPHFEGGQGGEFAEAGTDRHAAAHAAWDGNTGLLDMQDDESQAGINWALEYIRVHAPMSDHPVVWETKRSFLAPDFSEISGTPDVVCGLHLFDLKWRERDYTAQMAAYAAMLLQGNYGEVVTVHVLYMQPRRAQVFKLDLNAVEAILIPILERAGNKELQPSPCDYCGWCSKQLMCPAKTGTAAKVATGYAEKDLSEWHPSKMMDDPAQLSLALTIWRTILKKWGESVEFHAAEAVTKLGKTLPGYELKERAGKKFIADTARAYELSGLKPEQFLQACGVRLNTSKTTGLLGLDKLFAESAGSVAAGKREAEKRLKDVIQYGKSTMSLVATGGNEGGEE